MAFDEVLELFHIGVAICLITNLIRNGDGLILLTKIITIVNSIHDKSPRQSGVRGRFMSIEYKFGRKTYCLLCPMRDQIPWTHAAAFINGNPVDVTKEMMYYAGPAKNFHSIPIRPKDFDESYEKLAFRFQNDAVIHIEHEEIILPKLRAEQQRQLANGNAK